ncbi:hypothetical protein ACQP2F_20340 [Actinoplanes sp. CA-030573]|uniref:hypothetical protein n=1 Tax=Actinoplanes sp. CA-030573 TaxID=3239898 RepID=UPI003D89FE25
MSLDRVTRRRPLVVALTGVLVLLAACSAPAAAPPPGFTGYRWAVSSISHDGTTTPIPRSYAVSLRFTPDGHFGADEPVNYHSGGYRVTADGFVAHGLISTDAGYAGDDPVVLLAIAAIDAIGDDVPVPATVSGDTLTVTAGAYTLVAERDGRQAAF